MTDAGSRFANKSPPRRAADGGASATGEPGITSASVAVRSLPRIGLWAAAAVCLGILFVLGIALVSPRPEPFGDPPRPLVSLEWWLHPPADPGLLTLDMMPVGNFGGYLPREFYHRMVERAGFRPQDVTDVWLRDPEHLAVVKWSAQKPGGERLAEIWESADGGTSWKFLLDTGNTEPRCLSQIAEYSKCPGGPDAPVCSPYVTVFPYCGDVPDQHLFFYGKAELLRFSLDVLLKSKAIIAFSPSEGVGCDNEGFFWIPEQPRLQIPTAPDGCIARMLPSGRVLLASSAGFAIAGLPGDASQSGLSTSAPSLGQSAIPDGNQRPLAQPAQPQEASKQPGLRQEKRAPPSKRQEPFVQQQIQQQQIQQPQVQQQQQIQQQLPAKQDAPQQQQQSPLLALSPYVPFPPGTLPLRTVRVSEDGKSIVAAERVGNHSSVLLSHDGGRTWQRLAYMTRQPPPWSWAAFAFFLFSLSGLAREVFRPLPRADAASIADDVGNDAPIGAADFDALSFRPIAQGLFFFLRNTRTEPPVTIAVTGRWGSGKSSLMTILRDLLRDDEARPVWFNAWHHQREEHLLAALLENIRKQAVPPLRTWAGVGFRGRLLRRRLVGRLGVLIALLLILVAALVAYSAVPAATMRQWGEQLAGLYQTVNPRDAKARIGEAAKPEPEKKGDGNLLQLVALLPPSLAIPLLLFGIWSRVQPFPTAKPAELIGRRRPEGGPQRLSFRYRFQKEFGETCDALRTSTNAGLVIFIDDLDRCQPQQTVDLLEAVNFIVSAGQCFVVLGMDKDQVRRAVLAAYRSAFADLPDEPHAPAGGRSARLRFAERYLEKIINIEVPVPPPTPDQIGVLLTGDAPAPPPEPRLVRIRRQLGLLYRNGPILVLIGIAAGLVAAARHYLAGLGSLAESGAAAEAARAAAPIPPAAPFAGPRLSLPAVFGPDGDLAGAHAIGGFPWVSIVIAALLLAAAGAYIVRVWIDSLRRPVTDSPPFRDALRHWNRVILAAVVTPRGVKQYKNLLRYQAMRGRDPQTNQPGDRAIPDQYLVALGAVARADGTLLAEARRRETSLQALALERLDDESMSDRNMFATLAEALAGMPASKPGLAPLERYIPDYLELLA